MLFFDSVREVPRDFGPSAITVGKFDGVHEGHRVVIAELRSVAAERELTSCVVTFDRNPLSVLNPELCPQALVSNAQKVELLAGTGIDATLMLTFDWAFAARSAEDFVLEVIVGALHAAVVLVGPDFRFGARGAGDVALLREFGAEHGFEVRLIDEVRTGGERRISSTWIRELLAAGRVAEAAELLGSPPTLRAIVVHGQKRGRALGYPTANLSPELEGLIPADGVYAGWATVDGERFPAAISVGNNPTFEGVPPKQVEAFLLDVTIDLYDRVLEVEFVERVRPMEHFDSIDALIAQIRDDELKVRKTLGIRARERRGRGPATPSIPLG